MYYHLNLIPETLLHERGVGTTLLKGLVINHWFRCSSMGEDNNHHKVIATARGVFDQTGGTLSSEETGVSIVIPPGALGRKQEVYFKVCQDSSLLPPLDQEKGTSNLCHPHF